MDGTLSAAIAEYISQRKQAKLEPLQKALNKVLEKSDDPVAIAQAKADYHQKAGPIETEFSPEIWLTKKAKLAKQITIATHAPKYLNSDAKATGVYQTKFELLDRSYLVSQHLPALKADFIGNAAVLDVATLLKIEASGETLIDQLRKDQAHALSSFTEDPILLDTWKRDFQKALRDEKQSAHTLTKQIYFPVEVEAIEYHLLCPLYASSLSDQLYVKIRQSRFGESKDVRDARKKGEYDERIDVRFPSTAVQMFGGSKPQNISQLNSERYGQGFLLSSAPPSYLAQSKPPVSSHTLFNRQFSWRANHLVRDFKAFLTGLKKTDKNFQTRYKRDYFYVKPLIDCLLNFASEIQTIPQSAGWTDVSDCNMKRAHQLFLDIDNPNEAFQQERDKGDWLEVVASDFANWLLRKLESKENYLLGDVEQRYFKKLCLNELRAFERMGSVQEEKYV
jgi:CRISPR-associated protein Csy1